MKFNFNHFKGAEFEMNSNNLLKDILNLKELPNYFFILKKFGNKSKHWESHNQKQNNTQNQNQYQTEKKKDDSFTFDEYAKNLLSLFIETDGAYICMYDNNFNDNKNSQFFPFIVQDTFEIKKRQ